MAEIIEITENDILKLQVRSGSDSDRKAIILSVGEPGYTVDHKRLFVGDGTTNGGILVGNKFLGSVSDITTLGSNPHPGDLAFDTSKQTLFTFITGTGTALSNWQAVSRIFQASNNTLSVVDNKISVNSISANNIALDALGQSMTLAAGRVTLSSTIAINEIKSSNLILSSNLNIGNISYTFPSTQINNGILVTNGSGVLNWSSANSVLTASLPGLSATLLVDGGLKMFVNGNNDLSAAQTSVSLLTSAKVLIKGDHLPAANAVFNQLGNLVRSVNISSVTIKTYTDLLSYPQFNLNDINGSELQKGTSTYDFNGAHGVYEITLSDTLYITNSDINVSISNASYIDNKLILDNYIAVGNLNYRYFIIPTDANPDQFKKIVVYFYVPTLHKSPSSTVSSPVNGPGVLTPGYSNPRTRFSVTVYGIKV